MVPLRSAKLTPLVDQQAFDLMEHRRMSDIGVAAIDSPGTDDTNRRLPRLHGAHLHGRSVRTQQHVGIEIKRVVHRTRRVMPWNIQCFEVVVIVFDLRAFRDAIANMAEELLDPLQSAGHWMQSAGRLTAPRQGYVDPLGCQLRS